jgi:zinc finger CCHC domain-containing protein 9
MTRTRNKQHLTPKPKLTKEDRREKYTQLARDRKNRAVAKAVGRTQICYGCRLRGHSLAFCPSATASANDKDKSASKQAKAVIREKICYKCGSKDHSLSACPDYHSSSDTDLPFAQCFVCNEQGHLASQCSQNEKGVFPNGGACKKCGSNRHVSSKCSVKTESAKKNKHANDSASDNDDFDVSDLLESSLSDETSRKTTAVGQDKQGSASGSAKKRKVVNF